MPVTLRQAINAFCFQCRDNDPWAVANCEKQSCPLHPVRPNQSFEGKQQTDYDPDEVKQELIDALSFKGVKELSDVRSGHPSITRERTRTRHSANHSRDAQDPGNE
jgi:hypothetical protein